MFTSYMAIMGIAMLVTGVDLQPDRRQAHAALRASS